MKRVKLLAGVCFLSFVISSCGDLALMQKRRYRPGYYVPEHRSLPQISKEEKSALAPVRMVKDVATHLVPIFSNRDESAIRPVTSNAIAHKKTVPHKAHVEGQIRVGYKELRKNRTANMPANVISAPTNEQYLNEGGDAAGYATAAVILFLLTPVLLLIGGIAAGAGIIALLLSAIFSIKGLNIARRILKAHPRGEPFNGKGKTIYALVIGIIGVTLLSIGLLLLIATVLVLIMFGF